MLTLFKRKILPKRYLILNTIPGDITQFRARFFSKGSDFIRSLCKLYNTSDVEALWNKYKDTATLLNDTLAYASKKGATVVDDASLEDFRLMNSYDVIIIIAHHSNNSDEIEVQGELIASNEIIAAIPRDTKGVIDITSCYSAFLIPKIKAHVPESTIIGIDIATSLPFRLLLLGETIRMQCRRKEIDYKEILIRSISALPSPIAASSIKESSSTIHLGEEKLKSTVFAPREAEKGSDFLVSVFIHKREDGHDVELMARELDEEMVLQNSKTLHFEIFKGDKIDFQLSCSNNSKGDFKFDENKKGLIWEDEMASVEFCVSVSESCAKNAFIGILKIAVNKIPAGEMLFKTKIVHSCSSDIKNKCAELTFVPYDSAQERHESETKILQKLENQYRELQNQVDAISSEDTTSGAILLDMEMCKKCIDIIKEKHSRPKNKMLKVFISSTSDLTKYRQVVREQVESCEMYPDMYERWGQGNDYPRDMCCQHVLDSDIFVCVLGAKYGFIEPAWGMSMTEIEFRVAMKAEKPILIYIQNQYKEDMKKMLPDYVTMVELQNKFIDELRTKRMVGFFANEMNLALLSATELLTLKHKLL